MEEYQILKSIDPENKATRKIIDGSLEWMQNHPMEKIPVGRLCQKAGISKSTFYARFSDSQDLYDFLFDWEAESAKKELLDGIKGEYESVEELVRKFIYYFLGVVKTKNNITLSFLSFYRETFPSKIEEKGESFFQSLSIDKKMFHTLYLFYTGGFSYLIYSWSMGRISDEECGNMLISETCYFLHGIGIEGKKGLDILLGNMKRYDFIR